MGNRGTKSKLRNAFIYLNVSAEPIRYNDEKFWSQIWSEDPSGGADIDSITIQEIRMLRDGSPRNFALLSLKMIEKLHESTETLCNTNDQQAAVLNAARILRRIIPCMFEDPAWKSFFEKNTLPSPGAGESADPFIIYPEKTLDEGSYISYLPAGVCLDRAETSSARFSSHSSESDADSAKVDPLNTTFKTISLRDDTSDTKRKQECPEEATNNDKSRGSNTLSHILVTSICDLLFCPEFTVPSHSNSSVEGPPDDLKSLMTYDYIWEPGVGFESDINSTTCYDRNRTDLLRLLLACLSQTLYQTPENSASDQNIWLRIFTANDNRHALPLFTSLLNTVLSYKPPMMLPFNQLLFGDSREMLVELSIQILIVVLDDRPRQSHSDENNNMNSALSGRNSFVEYLSRIHRTEDFAFIIRGFVRLLNNRLEQNYLINSKQIEFEQELLVLFWKFCNFNKKFIGQVLRTQEVIDIVMPILFHLNENFQNPAKTALIHVGVFILLILSGERNFGVRLNKPYMANVLLNLPVFTGSHADLMIIIFHKLILYGQDLTQLYDFLMTIVLNISPYLKALSVLASKCLIQLLETFSSPYVIFTEPNFHQLVIFLLEILNNIIQYQFDGNANLVFVLIKKKEVFHSLAKLPSSETGIRRVLNKLAKQKQQLSELQQQSIETINSNDKTSEDNERCDDSSTDSRAQGNPKRFGAILSSNYPPSSPHPQTGKQEVSIVATPGLSHVTQPIHPFDTASSESGTPSISASVASTKANTFSFDDILWQPERDASQLSDNGDPQAQADGKQASECERSPESGGRDSGKPPKECGPPELINSDQPSASSIWRPTPEWAKQWKQSLPLHTVLRMIEVLSPQIEPLRENSPSISEEIEVVKFLQNSTIVGLLPVPHPILIRKYHTNSETTLWFRACTWGIIFVRNTIWTDTTIKLFRII